MLRIVTKGITYCLRLGPIPKFCGRCVGIQVSDCRGSEPSVLQRQFHDATDSSTILRWSICVKGVRIRGVTHKLRKHSGSSPQCVVALFKNEHSCSFTHHKSISITIPWARCSLGIVVSSRECSHRGKAGNRQRRHGGLTSSADHHLRISALYDAEGFPDTMRSCGTRSGACDIGTSRSILDRDLASCQVCDRSVNEERRYTRGSLRDEFAVLSLDHFEGADAAPNVDANPLSIFRRNMDRRLSRGVAGRRHRELDEATHFLHVLPLDEVFRYKTLYFTRKSARIVIG